MGVLADVANAFGAVSVKSRFFPVWFFFNNIGWSLIFVLGHALFWEYGVKEGVDKYGYTDDNFYDTRDPVARGSGGIASGPSGSGVFIVSLMLCVPITFIYLSQAIAAFPKFGGWMYNGNWEDLEDVL